MTDVGTSGVWRRPCRVLLVDRNRETSALLSCALHREDHQVIAVQLGLDIYSFIADDGVRRAEQPDVVVVVDHGEDPHLCMMSALCIRERRIPVLVVKAFGATQAAAWAERIGAELVHRALDSNAMLSAVRRLASTQDLGRGADVSPISWRNSN